MAENTNELLPTVTGNESHWRSLEETIADPREREAVKQEILKRYPAHFLSRREFMEWMGGLAAVLGTTACTRQPDEKILPYTKMPENLIPGKPQFYATTFVMGGAAQGLLVESHLGRPTKIEGNPDHPSNQGGTDSFAQASILDLYDPDRLKEVRTKGGGVSSWENFEKALSEQLAREASTGGKGVRVLSETVISPSLAAQAKTLLSKFPGAKWVQYEPVNRDAHYAGTELAFGQKLHAFFDVAAANVVVSFDSDFMNQGPGHVRYARDFASRRKIGADLKNFNRLYAFETTQTVSGTLADHRRPLKSAEIVALASWLAAKLGVAGAPAGALDEKLAKLAEVLLKDLQENRGKSLLVAGETQPKELHALVAALNTVLGNNLRTVFYTEPLEAAGETQFASLRELAQDLKSGAVSTLIILGGNPVYSAPADLKFADLLSSVSFSVHHTAAECDTSVRCSWQTPRAHYLESWGDAKAHDGSVSLQQPLIAPLYGGRSDAELISACCASPAQSGYDVLQGYWKSQWGTAFDSKWKRAVHDGVVAGSVAAVRSPSLRALAGISAAAKSGFEVLLRPDATVYDGRFANNGWLQELPKPVTKVTWENTVHLAPSTAARLKVANGERVRVAKGDAKVEGPAWIVPGQAQDTAVVHFGYGRRYAGNLGTGIGFDAFRLLASEGALGVDGVEVTRVSGPETVASTQRHFQMEGRDLIRSGSVGAFLADSHLFQSHAHHAAGAHDDAHKKGRPFVDENYAWGMAIDLSLCNGCNACIVACQSENNIPVVGKDQIWREREMQWLRVDRYYEGNPDNPEVFAQPVPCMHCEDAPCEVVCPVNATTHSPDGINEMTYNRCIGTKYCSNNCPYKVRRFNWYKYSDFETPSIQLGRNPDVTVRARGVMEKCTYCVQRVNAARIEAKKEDRLIRDGEVTPACASACPTQAIMFGNTKDENSRVAKWKHDSRNYSLLEELGTKPRTTYLAQLRNPNPAWLAIEGKGKGTHGHA